MDKEFQPVGILRVETEGSIWFVTGVGVVSGVIVAVHGTWLPSA